jgi:hypothetical protein
MFFSKRLIALIAVIAVHVLIARLLISALDGRAPGGSARGWHMIPIPLASSGGVIPV